MLIVKKVIKNTLLPIITKLGIENFFSTFSKNNNLILCFHGVSNFGNPINKRHMPASQFETLIKYLKNNFDIVSINNFFMTPSGKNKRIGITFDDGYLNNYTVALPILENYKIPATFFIATEGLTKSNHLMWPDIFDLLKLDISNEQYLFNNCTFIKRKDSIVNKITGETIQDHIKKMSTERDELINDFRNRYKIDLLLNQVPPEIYAFLDVNQLKKFSCSEFVDIGSHCHKHYNLSNISSEISRNELLTSKKILEDIIQKPVISVAYPDGSYNNTVKNIAEECGYKYQLAITYKETSDLNDHRILSRYSISNSTNLEVNKILVNQNFSKVGF